MQPKHVPEEGSKTTADSSSSACLLACLLACCERRFSAERVVKDDRELNYYSSESVKISTGSAREGVESQAGLARKMLLAQVSLGKCCLRRS